MDCIAHMRSSLRTRAERVPSSGGTDSSVHIQSPAGRTLPLSTFFLLLLNQLTNLFREIGPLQGFVFQKADSNLRLLEPVLRAVAEKQEHLAGREDNGSRKRARIHMAGMMEVSARSWRAYGLRSTPLRAPNR